MLTLLFVFCLSSLQKQTTKKCAHIPLFKNKIMEDYIFDKLKSIETYTLLAAKKVLSLEDVTLLTGLSKSHIYKLTYSHQIPHYKPTGKQIYFDRDEIESWLKRNRVDTVEEIEQQAVNYLVTGKKKKGGCNDR